MMSTIDIVLNDKTPLSFDTNLGNIVSVYLEIGYLNATAFYQVLRWLIYAEPPFDNTPFQMTIQKY